MNRVVVNRRRRGRLHQVAAVLALRVPERVVHHHLSDGGQVLGPAAAGDDAGHADDRLVMVFRLDPDHRGLERALF